MPAKSDLVSPTWLLDHFSAALLVPLVYVAAMTIGGFSRPSPVLVLEGAQFVVLAPAYLVLAWSVGRHRWVTAFVALLVCLAHIAFTLPAATADDVPVWVDDAPTFTLLSANVLYRNTEKDAVAALVADADADVVILNEVVDAQMQALTDAGVLERYPTHLYTQGAPFGDLLLSRLPEQSNAIPLIGGSFMPSAEVVVGESTIRVFAVHVTAPKRNASRALWRRNLEGITQSVAERNGEPQVYAGDFNSSLWHGPFRKMLTSGLTDAHDALGEGLGQSWGPDYPVARWFGPILQIDHAVFTPGIFPRSIDEVIIPGSDHRGFMTTLAVEQEPNR